MEKGANLHKSTDLPLTRLASTIYETNSLFLSDKITIGELRIWTSIALAQESGDKLNVTKLAKYTRISRYKVLRVVQEGVRSGFLEQSEDPKDRRIKYLKFTEQAWVEHNKWKFELNSRLKWLWEFKNTLIVTVTNLTGMSGYLAGLECTMLLN